MRRLSCPVNEESIGRRDERSEVSLRRCRQEWLDLVHPSRANVGRELVELIGVVTQDDENEVIRRNLNDVESADSLRNPRFWH